MIKKVYYPKTKPGKGYWDQKKKLEVLQTYILLGNLALAARTNNVPEITVRQWKVTQWWKDNEEELRRSGKLQLSAKLTTLVEKSMNVLEERLTNGDFFWDKKNNCFIRKGISAEHANKITSGLIDRVLAVEKAAKPEKITDEGLESRLQKIAAILVSAKTPIKAKDYTDVSFLEVRQLAPVEGPSEGPSLEPGDTNPADPGLSLSPDSPTDSGTAPESCHILTPG